MVRSFARSCFPVESLHKAGQKKTSSAGIVRLLGAGGQMALRRKSSSCVVAFAFFAAFLCDLGG
jgi:hypothetical protein